MLVSNQKRDGPSVDIKGHINHKLLHAILLVYDNMAKVYWQVWGNATHLTLASDLCENVVPSDVICVFISNIPVF